MTAARIHNIVQFSTKLTTFRHAAEWQRRKTLRLRNQVAMRKSSPMWHVYRDDETHAWRWWQTATDGRLLKRSSGAFVLFLEAYEDAKRHGCTGMPDFASYDDALNAVPQRAWGNPPFARNESGRGASSGGAGGRMSTNFVGELGGADRPRIYIDEEWERVYWSETFGVSMDGLKRVLREIGDDAADVKRYFAANRAAGERRKA